MERDEVTVVELELRLLEPSVRADRAALAELLHPAFVEFGSSGRTWDRGAMIDELAGSPAVDPELEISELTATHVGVDVILVTFIAATAQRSTLRSSIWVRAAGRWQLRFHQGTVAPHAGGDQPMLRSWPTQ